MIYIKILAFVLGVSPQLGALCEISYPLFISQMGVWGLAPKYKKIFRFTLDTAAQSWYNTGNRGVISCLCRSIKKKLQKSGSPQTTIKFVLSILKELGMHGRMKLKSAGCLLHS